MVKGNAGTPTGPVPWSPLPMVTGRIPSGPDGNRAGLLLSTGPSLCASWWQPAACSRAVGGRFVLTFSDGTADGIPQNPS